jgi:soluble lytic murein transglycosylase
VKFCCSIVIFVGVFAVQVGARASVAKVALSSKEPPPRVRWMYGEGEAPKGKGIVALLAQLKKAQFDGNFSLCLERAREVRAKAKGLHPWIAVIELDCAVKAVGGSAEANRLARVLEEIEHSPSWLFEGPQASALRAEAVSGYLLLAEQDLKNNRARSWKSINRLEALAAYTDEKARAAQWRIAGELSFLSQKPEAAREYFRRSLNEVESADIRVRLNAVDAALSRGGSEPPPPQPTPARVVNPQIEASPTEVELVDRITVALKTGDLLPAVEDAVKLIRGFPGGSRAKWASDRALEVYFNLAEKNEAKFTLLRDQVARTLEKTDADRLGEWARLAYNRGQYNDSLQFALKALRGLDGARTTKVFEIAGDAAVASDHYDIARDMYGTLVEKHAGTSAARTALFRLALVHLRLGQYQQAISHLERLIVMPQADNLELVARYWLWRALEKTKSDRAPGMADELAARFPFSYYGLRARIERAGGALDLKPLLGDEKTKVDSTLWLTERERLAWERLELLLAAGWLDEAQGELKLLPSPLRANDKAMRALFWAAAGQYVQASKLVNEAWDEQKDLRRPPFLRASLPLEFAKAVEAYARDRHLEASLVFGLIKQESGFNTRAVSSSNALGLMQIIPPTAQEIASDLRMDPVAIPDGMFEPERNIKMGVYYLSKLLSKYQGHIPLALAAYNAGPARMDRWLRARPTLEKLASTRSSSPFDELWIDEIPYGETSFYVKAILRNVLLYRALDQGRVEIPNPIWSFDGMP